MFCLTRCQRSLHAWYRGRQREQPLGTTGNDPNLPTPKNQNTKCFGLVGGGCQDSSIQLAPDKTRPQEQHFPTSHPASRQAPQAGSACVCSSPAQTSCWLGGILYLKPDASVATHTSSGPVNHTLGQVITLL